MLGRGTQARGRECREGGRIGFTVRQRLQHAAGADAEQVRHEAGHLDVRFLEQGLQPILELHAIAGDLVLAAHHGAPEPLLGVGHEAQGELLRDQAFHQPLRIGEILLAPAASTIRLRLGEMERAREPRRAVTRAAPGTPVLFQGFPHRPPVLRGRLHDDFLDLVLDQPVGEATQVGRRRADLLALEVEIAVDLDVGHHDRQHLLVDVNSCDPVRHRPLLLGAESVPRRISQGRELSPGLARTRTTLNYSVNHARSGPNSCSASIAPLANLDLAAPSPPFCPIATIFILFRGPAGPAATSCGNRPVRRASSTFAPIRAPVERLNGGRRKAFTTQRGVGYDCFHGALFRAGLSECPTYKRFARVLASEVPPSRTPGWLQHDAPSQLALASVAPAARLISQSRVHPRWHRSVDRCTRDRL